MKRKANDIKSFFKSTQSPIECPLCGSHFDQGEIEKHAALCGVSAPTPSSQHSQRESNSTTKSEKKGYEPDSGGTKNAFACLMSAQAELKRHHSYSKAHFRLDMIGGKLHPSFFFEAEVCEVSPFATVSRYDVSVRKFVMSMSDCANDVDGNTGCVSERVGTLELTLCSNIASGPAPETNWSARDQQPQVNPVHASVLKSMLQKGVRRRAQDKVVRLCSALMAASPQDCLRRLPIVILEDCCLHPGFPVLVWLMIANSKGFQLSPALIGVVLHIMYEVAGTSLRDRPSDAAEVLATVPAPESLAVFPSTPRSFALIDLPPGAPRTLIVALLLRSAYGGMAWDVAMTESYALQWASRLFTPVSLNQVSTERVQPSSAGMELYLAQPFIEQIAASHQWGLACVAAFPAPDPAAALVPPDVRVIRRLIESHFSDVTAGSNIPDIECFESVGGFFKSFSLRTVDLVPEGIDHHCNSKLVDHLLATCEISDSSLEPDREAAAERIRSALWTFRSAVNTRSEWLVAKGIPYEADMATRHKNHIQSVLATQKRAQSKTWAGIAKEVKSFVDGCIVEYSKKMGR